LRVFAVWQGTLAERSLICGGAKRRMGPQHFCHFGVRAERRLMPPRNPPSPKTFVGRLGEPSPYPVTRALLKTLS